MKVTIKAVTTSNSIIKAQILRARGSLPCRLNQFNVYMLEIWNICMFSVYTL